MQRGQCLSERRKRVVVICTGLCVTKIHLSALVSSSVMPPPPPHLELKGCFYFLLEGGSEVAGEGSGLLEEVGVMDERTCLVERRMDVRVSLYPYPLYNTAYPAPALPISKDSRV